MYVPGQMSCLTTVFGLSQQDQGLFQKHSAGEQLSAVHLLFKFARSGIHITLHTGILLCETAAEPWERNKTVAKR